MKGEKLYPQTMPTAPGAFSDSFDANRTSRVWHGGDREGPLNEAQRPHVCGVRVALSTGYTRVLEGLGGRVETAA